MAAAGRPNVDGEAHQGSLAGYVAGQVELLRSRRVIYCHHDNWMPPITRENDVAPITAELKERCSYADVLEMQYAEPTKVLAGL